MGSIRRVMLTMALASGALIGGCDVDSFLDQSVMGRWENTPVVLPIIDRLDVIDEPDDTLPGLSEPTSEDLIPEITEYVFEAGDTVSITIFELLTTGADSILTRRINELGYISLPVLGEIKVAGLTPKQLEQRIIDILHPDILRNPQVTAVVAEGRARTFKVLGPGQGEYAIIKNDFRLLDAIAMARIPDTKTLYIIRPIVLDARAEGNLDPSPPGTNIELPEPGGAGQPAPGGDDPDVLDPGRLIESLTDGLEDPEGQPDKPEGPEAPQPEAPRPEPGFQPENPALSQALDDPTAEGRYINVNGKWVLVQNLDDEEAMAEAEADGEALPPRDQMLSQRIIEVDAEALMKGDTSHNIVIRPDDIIRVPGIGGGNIYIGGPGIGRPGTYTLPGEKTLTLKQLIISAGGLSGVAIPERVDLTRRLDNDQEVTIRISLRGINEGVQPDIYLKPDDTLNIGTNILAGFVAVIRNSFRFSYGFGFLADKNFSEDIFGPVN